MIWRSAWVRIRRLNPLIITGALALSAAVAVLSLRRPVAAPPPTPTSPPPVQTGALEIATDPVGALVWVDGTDSGRSPLSLPKVSPGRHAIRVGLQGFSSAEVTLDVPAGAFAVPLQFTLHPVSAILQILSEPAGATIWIDGQSRETTPAEGVTLPPGRHAVELTRSGYLPWKQTVQARAGDRIPLLGRLDIQRSAADLKEHLRSLGWVREGDFLEPGPDVTPPRRISGEAATYPEPARQLKLRGTVAVELTVTERGEPVDLRVVESAEEILDDAVLAAVRTWRYAPALKNGVKVRTRVRVEQGFGGED